MRYQYSFILFLFCCSSVFGQKFSTPAPGKANVCIAAVDNSFRDEFSGSTYDVEVYENDKYIDLLKYTQYVIFEADTGAQVYWVGTSGFVAGAYNNLELFFLEANLQEGKSYILIPKVKFYTYPGFSFNRFFLEPFSLSDTVNYTRLKRLLRHIEPKETSQKKIDKMNTKKNGYIERKLKRYQELKEENNEDQIGILNPEQYIPVEDLKW